jgi:hypothetical protein
MSKDQMQDVFPIVFDFKKGEAPTAEKLTGIVKQIDNALASSTQAVGDPWDQQQNQLSLENLGQTSIARMLGPSDYLSPIGGSINEESSSSFVVSLLPEKNQWCLGFPLIKKNGTITIKENSTTADVIPLVWGTDITLLVANPVFVSRKTSLALVVSSGDFHVDFYTGTITSYSVLPTGSTVYLIVSNLSFLPAGPPWATNNVIPTWEETSAFCAVTGGGTSWELTLPTVVKMPRTGSNSFLAGGIKTYNSSDVFISFPGGYYSGPGVGTQYRLPQALIDNPDLHDPGKPLPEGYVLLWDDTEKRVIPSLSFYYNDEHTLNITGPTNWLYTGSSRYRLIVAGSSAAESINYLNSTMRDNRHVGLTDGALIKKTLFYSSPISHDTLTNKYSSAISTTDPKYLFRDSSMPTNCHPQYLHRFGYNTADASGNSANAMRGNLVFTGTNAAMGLGTGVNAANGYNTYGVMFGGGDVTETEARNARISMQGMTNETWTSGIAKHFPFSITETGLTSYFTYSENYYGALAIDSWLGSPLWVRGIKDIGQTTGLYGTDDYHKGASVAFDIGWWGEYNHIKVSIPIHDNNGYEATNMPANTAQTSFASVLPITPSLTNRLSPYQVREFRFRGGAYLPEASNKGGSLGAIGKGTLVLGTQYEVYQFRQTSVVIGEPNAKGIILEDTYGDISGLFVVGRTINVTGATNSSNNGAKTISAVYFIGTRTYIHVSETLIAETSSSAKAQSYLGEFDSYYTSPGMAGVDFLNVYSNAIFFSDTGDGKKTSFTAHGAAWMNDGDATQTPSGIYFIPREGTTKPRFNFFEYDTTESHNSLSFGYAHGFAYDGTGIVSITTTSSASLGLNSSLAAATTNLIGQSVVFTELGSDTSVSLVAGGTYLDRLVAEAALVDLDYHVIIGTIGDEKKVLIQTSGEESDIFLKTYGLVADINLASDAANFYASAKNSYLTGEDSVTVRFGTGSTKRLKIENDLAQLTHLAKVEISSSGQLWLASESILLQDNSLDTYGIISKTSTGLLISSNSVQDHASIEMEAEDHIELRAWQTITLTANSNGTPPPASVDSSLTLNVNDKLYINGLTSRGSSSGAKPLYIDTSTNQVFYYTGV